MIEWVTDKSIYGDKLYWGLWACSFKLRIQIGINYLIDFHLVGVEMYWYSLRQLATYKVAAKCDSEYKRIDSWLIDISKRNSSEHNTHIADHGVCQKLAICSDQWYCDVRSLSSCVRSKADDRVRKKAFQLRLPASDTEVANLLSARWHKLCVAGCLSVRFLSSVSDVQVLWDGA